MQLDFISKLATSTVRTAQIVTKPTPPRQETAAAGKVLPQSTSQPSQAEQLKTAVGQINEYVRSFRTDLQFVVDEESGRSVVKVIDTESGELVRQIPSEQVLAVSRAIESNLKSSSGIILQDKV